MKLTGAKKKAFLERMAKGRKKAARKNPKKKPPVKKRKKPVAKKKRPVAKKRPARKNPPKRTAKKKNAGGKLRGQAKAAFLARMKRGRAKAKRTGAHNPKRKSGRNPKRGKRNPDSLDDAIDKYTEFHGRAPGHIIEVEQHFKMPGNYAEMGKLKELRFNLDSANKDFPIEGFGDCLAVCTPDGRNIAFIGGNQSLNLPDLGIDSDKDLVDLGICTMITYDTKKGFHDFVQTNYWHRFGEDTHERPRLGYDRLNKTLYLTGGAYEVRPEGIVN